LDVIGMLAFGQRLARSIVGFSRPADKALRRVDFDLPLGRSDELQIVGAVFSLSGHSRLHSSYSVARLRGRVCPSLPLGQFRYYTDTDGSPAAFCNWAWLTQPVLDELLETGRDLQEHEFKCGDVPFLCELLAPFGHSWTVARDLAELPFFRGRRVPAIRSKVHADGTLSWRYAPISF
jgi:cytolysin-activating lysine-acyltransferase